MSLGPSRCFPFWQELLACYVVNTSAEDVSGQAKCAPVLEDYYECLHHKKEVCVTRRNDCLEHARLRGRWDSANSCMESSLQGHEPCNKPTDDIRSRTPATTPPQRERLRVLDYCRIKNRKTSTYDHRSIFLTRAPASLRQFERRIRAGTREAGVKYRLNQWSCSQYTRQKCKFPLHKRRHRVCELVLRPIEKIFHKRANMLA